MTLKRMYPACASIRMPYVKQMHSTTPTKKALMFTSFTATNQNPGTHLVGGTVFTCLSHDIIAHETTHAILDGVQRRFMENTHPDALAFHEAFADIVALFQHFSFPEVLRQQIGKTRGDLGTQNLLGQLAQEFGVAIGNYNTLRDAIGYVNPDTNRWEPLTPDPKDYLNIVEPHARGSILVAAVFDAFTQIYKTRTADLMRIASGGTGVLASGALTLTWSTASLWKLPGLPSKYCRCASVPWIIVLQWR